jgi:hypothetical protein
MHLQPYDATSPKKFHRPATECWLFGGLLSHSIGGCLPTPFRSRDRRRGIEGNVEGCKLRKPHLLLHWLRTESIPRVAIGVAG